MAAPPACSIVSQIHNAPGWRLGCHLPCSTQTPTRVNNSLGWNGTSFVPYQPLIAYQLTSTGSCTSASSGGPSGTGSSISDGTCTWKYLSKTDYVTITGWNLDNAAWSNQAYNYAVRVLSDTPLRAYFLLGMSGCTSTVAPTGTSSSFTTADGCN